ncbi:MAG TPA: TIGR02266 family protein [Thermodesulfobacteriota bacterium]|nr:TIGR02266 family protein [Thermodesulfobacteriota bacterium]
MNAARGEKRILVVDDVRLFRELVEVLLAGSGYRVVTAASGRDALELARREPPDLILLDLYMPGMDGEATCRAIREDPRLADVPVIMVTSGGAPQEVARCVAAGCDDYLLKPVRRGPLLRKIGSFVDERALWRIRVPLETTVEFAEAAGRSPRAGRAVNISAGGLFVETPEPPLPGSELALSFRLPDGAAPLAAEGRVAWVNEPAAPRKRDCGPGMGIAFRALSEAGRSTIVRYVRRQRRAALAG